MSTQDPLVVLGLTASLAQVLRYFALRPGARAHLRELQRELGVSSASSQRDLARLVELGVLHRLAEGRTVRYAVADKASLWGPLRALVGEASDPAVLVREALRGVAGVDAAFVYGSTAASTARSDSDVDLFVVGDSIDTRALHRALAEAGLLMGREVNPVRYTRTELAARLAAGTRFVREALTGPKAWVAGTASAVAPIAIAAGIPFAAEPT